MGRSLIRITISSLCGLPRARSTSLTCSSRLSPMTHDHVKGIEQAASLRKRHKSRMPKMTGPGSIAAAGLRSSPVIVHLADGTRAGRVDLGPEGRLVPPLRGHSRSQSAMKRWPPATTAPSTGEGVDRPRAMLHSDHRPRSTAQGTTRRQRSPASESRSRPAHPPRVVLHRGLTRCDLRTRADASLSVSSRWRDSHRLPDAAVSTQPRRYSWPRRLGNDPSSDISGRDRSPCRRLIQDGPRPDSLSCCSVIGPMLGLPKHQAGLS